MKGRWLHIYGFYGKKAADNVFKGEGRFKYCNEAMNMINKGLRNKSSESNRMAAENKAKNVIENRF